MPIVHRKILNDYPLRTIHDQKNFVKTFFHNLRYIRFPKMYSFPYLLYVICLFFMLDTYYVNFDKKLAKKSVI